jgi:hypothetical protein
MGSSRRFLRALLWGTALTVTGCSELLVVDEVRLQVQSLALTLSTRGHPTRELVATYWLRTCQRDPRVIIGQVGGAVILEVRAREVSDCLFASATEREYRRTLVGLPLGDVALRARQPHGSDLVRSYVLGPE